MHCRSWSVNGGLAMLSAGDMGSWGGACCTDAGSAGAGPPMPAEQGRDEEGASPPAGAAAAPVLSPQPSQGSAKPKPADAPGS
eukprot:8417980-Heterocapsa_arctica.AAC.1